MRPCHDCPSLAARGVRCFRCAVRHAARNRRRYHRAKLARVRAKVGRAA